MWMDIPYQHSTKSDFQRLLDLGFETADLLGLLSPLTQNKTPDSSSNTAGEAAAEVESRRALLMDVAAAHIGRLKAWEDAMQVHLVASPYHDEGHRAHHRHATALELAERYRLRGYPSKPSSSSSSFPTPSADSSPRSGSSTSPCSSSLSTAVTFDALQAARGMHLCWTLQLKTYLAVLDCMGDDEEDASSSSSFRSPPSPHISKSQVRRDSAALADRIALYGNLCCQNLWQSYGPMVSAMSLETALEWYARADRDNGKNSVEETEDRRNENRDRCRALLDAVARVGETQREGQGEGWEGEYGEGAWREEKGREERRLAREYQQVTFGGVDVLGLPWC